MTYARFTTWRLRPGTRDKALDVINGFNDQAKRTEGFQGNLAFFPLEDPNTFYIVSLWDSEESLNASEGGIYQEVIDAVGDMAVEAPKIRKMETRQMSAQVVSIPS